MASRRSIRQISPTSRGTEGYELARYRLPSAQQATELARNLTGSWNAAELPHRVSQKFVEQVLRRHATDERTVSVNYGWRLDSHISSAVDPTLNVSAGADDHRFPSGFVVRELFAGGRGRITVLLWIMFFMNLLDLYFLNSSLPTLMNDLGLEAETAILVTTLFQIGGAIGGIVLRRLIDRRASFSVLAWTYLGAAVCIFLIGQAGAALAPLILTVSAAVCVVGGQMSSNAVAAGYYPTAMRSTGVGWALGIGRIGSIIGPTLGGTLLSMGGETRGVFWAASIPVLIATIVAITAAIVERPRPRSVLSAQLKP